MAYADALKNCWRGMHAAVVRAEHKPLECRQKGFELRQ